MSTLNYAICSLQFLCCAVSALKMKRVLKACLTRLQRVKRKKSKSAPYAPSMFLLTLQPPSPLKSTKLTLTTCPMTNMCATNDVTLKRMWQHTFSNSLALFQWLQLLFCFVKSGPSWHVKRDQTRPECHHYRSKNFYLVPVLLTYACDGALLLSYRQVFFTSCNLIDSSMSSGRLLDTRHGFKTTMIIISCVPVKV